MADAKATFAIELDSTGVVKPGDDSAAALEKLKGKIAEDIQALSGLNAAMRNLKGGSSVNVDAFRKLKDQIAAHKGALGAAQADYVNLGGKLGELAKKAGTGSEGMGTLASAVEQAGGPLGGAIAKLKGVTEGLGKAGIAGIVVVAVAAIVALEVAVVALTAKFISYGLAVAGARRAELLHLQGMTTIRNMFGQVAGKATDVQAAIDKVSGSSALGRDKIAGYAEQLYRMGLRGKNLDDALEGTAIKASVQGDQWASLFMSMAAGANLTGQSVSKLADQVRGRLGGIAKAQALDFGVQIEKLQKNFAALFGDVKIEGFLSSLHKVLAIFSQQNVVGQALKRLVTTIFGPFDQKAGAAGDAFKKFVLGGIILTLKFTLAVLKMANFLKDTFGEKGQLRGAFRPFESLVDSAKDAFTSIQKGDWAGLGLSIVEGIVSGMLPAGPLLVGAVKTLGATIKNAFKSDQEIHSPSKVWADLGYRLPQGAAQGVRRGTPLVARSIAEMVVVPPELAPARKGGAASVPGPRSTAGNATGQGAAGGGSRTVTIGELHYHAAGKEDAHQAAISIRDELARVLEGTNLQLGAA